MKILIGCENVDGIDLLISDLKRAGLPKNSEVRVVTSLDSMDSLSTGSLRTVTDASGELSGSMQIDTSHLNQEAAIRANKVVALLAQVFPQWSIQPVGRIGSPKWTLMDEAKKMGADLLVLGSKGHSLVNRILFGSVSHSVVNHAHCSVRIARLSQDRHAGHVKLLVGLDGSPTGNTALDAILGREWSPGTEVRLVSVYDEDVLPVSAFENNYTDKAIADAINESRSALQAALQKAGEKLTAAGLVTTTAFRTGTPREVLMKEIEDFNADCIFLGAKGHSLIDRLLVGSTSANMAAEATCSVEIVR